MASGPLKWGIISTARINDEVIPQIKASQSAQLIAVASRDRLRAQSYARAHDIPAWYGSYDELFDSPEVDCVYISAPNSTHASLSAQALRAGKHVLCEKPLASSAREGAWLVDVAAESDRRLMEAFMYRHHDKTLTLRRLVSDGTLGEIDVIRSWFHFRAADPESDIRFQPELAGGSLRDIGCYCTSLALFLIGQAPASVAATARIGRTGVDEAMCGILHFDAGALAVFDCSMVADLDIGVTVIGTNARAHVDTPWYPHLPPSAITLDDATGRHEISTSAVNPYLLEVENFCAVVRGGEQATVNHDESLRNLSVMDQLAAAADISQYELDPKGASRQ
jgi:D-xylose 1-dehydrogenase (NADP+, D-xylono-1,5-lactone-forming)